MKVDQIVAPVKNLALCLILLAGINLLAHNASARTAEGPSFASWITFSYAQLGGGNSCQATQCTRGSCDNSYSFRYYADREYDGAFPAFDNEFKLPPGSKVTLSVAGKKFVLMNSSKKRGRFFQAPTKSEANQINLAIRALARSNGNKKFFVIKSNGRKIAYSARGIDSVFNEFRKKCQIQIP